MTIVCLFRQLFWPEQDANTSGHVNPEGWWSDLECSAVEAAVYRDVHMEPINATDIAPWIPPICRGPVMLNTESHKKRAMGEKLIGCPKQLGGLVREGRYDPLTVGSQPANVLRDICTSCEICIYTRIIKGLVAIYNTLLHACHESRCIILIQPQMILLLEKLYSYLIRGNSECHSFEAVQSCSGGKVFKNCHHQVCTHSYMRMQNAYVAV